MRCGASGKLAEIPGILLTALALRGDRERGIDAGANTYLVKCDIDQGRRGSSTACRVNAIRLDGATHVLPAGEIAAVLNPRFPFSMMSKVQPEPSDILIVEDGATQAEQLTFTLERHGYPVRQARSGQEALARVREKVPLLVISDINMPEMDGYELCRRIRSDPALAGLPVILLTSLSDPEDVVRGLESGADHFVAKPLDEEHLLSRIRQIMANRQLRALESTPISLEISLGGKKHLITADRLQMLHLLLSTYESAVLRSRQLLRVEEELRRLNENLEEKVRDRTAALTAEIAERKRLYEELQESEGKYRQLFASNPMPAWVFDADTLRVLAVNEAAVRHYGFSREEFLTLTIRDIRPAEEVPKMEAWLKRMPQDFRRSVWRHRKKDGTLIDVEITAHELAVEGRRARLVLANDITEPRRAEEERRVGEERTRAIFNSSPVAMAYGTIEGRFADVNDQLCAFLDYPREELIGRALDEIVFWADPDECALVRKSLQARESVREEEVRFRRKSGEIRTALLSVQVLQLGAEPMLLTTIVDITERKVLQAQLNRIQRLDSVGRLASGIAHDMNNILAPIMMCAPLLRMNLAPAEVEKTLSTIETSAQRGAALVRQLMIFGRGVEGERRPVRPADVIGEVRKIAEQTFPKNIGIATQVSPEVWMVRGDATQLHHVLLNLCVNARDAMLDGGELTLSADNFDLEANDAALHPDAKPGKYVVMKVADTGIGIPPEIADRIFDPFFTTKEPGKGTGLGLSNVVGIVRSHHGFVRMGSRGGRGTTFEIYFPASLDGSSNQGVTKRPAKALGGTGELILVIDDEESIRTVLRDMLQRHQYRVLTAQDGVEAAVVFAANPGVKLAITDLDMPVMDGVNLARVLRRLNPALPIIISTGLAERSGAEKRRTELDAIGVSAILTKPYPVEKLLRAVREAIVPAVRAGGEELRVEG